MYMYSVKNDYYFICSVTVDFKMKCYFIKLKYKGLNNVFIKNNSVLIT